MTIEQAKHIGDDPNKYQYTLRTLREAATILTEAGWHFSADNIHIHLRLHHGEPR